MTTRARNVLLKGGKGMLFKKTRKFVDDVSVPCLTTTMRNSTFPRLAAKHSERFAEDPEFRIYLRGKDPAQITEWQEGMLQRLIEKQELIVVIEKEMLKYFQRHHDEGTAVAVERDGIAPHVVLSDVVIDDSKRQVILTLSSDVDANLMEHGIVIYLKSGRWSFDSDYLSDYLNEVEEEAESSEQEDFEVDDDENEAVEETPSAGDPDGLTLLLGVWDYDLETHREHLKQQGKTDERIKGHVDFYSNTRFEFAVDHVLYWWKYPKRKPTKGHIVRSSVNGNKVSLTVKWQGIKEQKQLSFVLEHGKLRCADEDTSIYQRGTR